MGYFMSRLLSSNFNTVIWGCVINLGNGFYESWLFWRSFWGSFPIFRDYSMSTLILWVCPAREQTGKISKNTVHQALCWQSFCLQIHPVMPYFGTFSAPWKCNKRTISGDSEFCWQIRPYVDRTPCVDSFLKIKDKAYRQKLRTRKKVKFARIRAWV